MSLSLEKLQFANFRSYERLELDDLGPINLFIGPNAAGKTNIVEGIQLLSSQRSFRSSSVDQLIHHGQNTALLKALLTDDKRSFDISLRLQREEKKKTYTLNDKVKRTSELQGMAPTIVFIPDHLGLAKGSLSSRRDEIDYIGAQVNSNYLQIKKDYDKLQKHKNKLLKEEGDITLIQSVNDLMVVCGSQLSCYRYSLFQRLSKLMQDFYSQMTHETEQFSAQYCLSWSKEEPVLGHIEVAEIREQYQRSLEESLEEERTRKRMIVGPHADKLRFFIDQKETEYFASQGQQRSVVLALKLAEALLIDEFLDKKPILLLDDVMSELDKTRRQAFIELISGSVQSFITTANIEYFDKDIIQNAKVVNINS